MHQTLVLSRKQLQLLEQVMCKEAGTDTIGLLKTSIKQSCCYKLEFYIYLSSTLNNYYFTEILNRDLTEV